MFKKYKAEVKAQRSRTGSPAPKAESAAAVPEKGGDKSKRRNSERRPMDRHNSTWDKDVMISYSHQNRPFMRKLKEGLETRGISVWVDEVGLKAGVDFLSKIGQAIIDAKCLISLLSIDSIKSKYCQDELALAYVSQKHIFPCGMAPAGELFPLMDTGMKLQLARFQWSVFVDDAQFDATMDDLVDRMKKAIAPADPIEKNNEEQEKSKKDEKKTEKKHQRTRMNKVGRKKSSFLETMSESSKALHDENMESFWQANFKDRPTVPWKEFLEVFQSVYKTPLTQLYTASDTDWLFSIIRRELEVRNPATDSVTRDIYDDFCTVDDEAVPFFVRVQDQAVESYTMKEVFSMESSVRIEAIENLGKFRSAAVVEALLDLLSDPDNNVRAVAAISLARTGESSPKIVQALLTSLSDKDRLVRESGCLALGHLKASQAVPKILHLWRNDFISHVREAATVALHQIGGEEAANAIHMTKVLSDEIRSLTQE